MAWQISSEALEAAVGQARRTAAERPGRALELAMVLRWTGQTSACVEAARRAGEHAEAVAARSGSWTKLARAGAAWRLAGDLERALAVEARAATAVLEDPTADPGVPAGLAYLAGDDRRAREVPARPTRWTRIVAAVARSRAGGDPGGLLEARSELIELIRAGSHLPRSGGLPPLGLWEWLEETYAVQAALDGRPTPTCVEILGLSGLLDRPAITGP